MPGRGTFNQQSMLDTRNQNRKARPRDSNMKLDVLSVAALVLLASGTGPASAGESMAAGARPAESPRDATYLVEAQPVRLLNGRAARLAAPLAMLEGFLGDIDEAEIDIEGTDDMRDLVLGQLRDQPRQAPAQLVLSERIDSAPLLAEVLSESAGRKVRIQSAPRGDRRRMLDMTRNNARQALLLELASQANLATQFEDLRELLGLEEAPAAVECFDISHTGGNETVGACVVFDQAGPVKSRYRRYNLRDITPGDDYAAMHQVLTRRYGRIRAEEGSLPDLVLIDGGVGQLNAAMAALATIDVSLPMAGLAKREEEVWLPGEPGTPNPLAGDR